MTVAMFLNAKKDIDYDIAQQLFFTVSDALQQSFPREGPHSIDTIQMRFCMFRNVIAVHNWFVENVQEGEDNYREYGVTVEKFEELYNIISEVLEDHEKAAELLPVPSTFSSMFFSGGDEYDDQYFHDLNEVRNKLKNAIEWTNHGWYFTYDSYHDMFYDE